MIEVTFEERAEWARESFAPEWGRDTFTIGALDMLRIAAFAGFDARTIARLALTEPGHRGQKINARTIERIMGEASRAVADAERKEAGR